MKTAFITGANRGLGYGFVEHLLLKGYIVFAGTRKVDSSLASKDNLFWVECDVTSDASIMSAVDFVKNQGKTIDILVNNAGVNKDTINSTKESVTVLGSLTRDALLDIFNINTLGPILITQAFLPVLSQNAFVLNVSSVRGSFTDSNGGTTPNYGYRASKAALNMLTLCSLRDLPVGIKTFAYHPGGVHTDMNPDGKYEPLDQARKAISFIENWDDTYNGKLLSHEGMMIPF